jgi:hypothetical protein
MLSRAGAVVATAALATLRLAVAGPLALPIHAGEPTGIFRVRVVCDAFAP